MKNFLLLGFAFLYTLVACQNPYKGVDDQIAQKAKARIDSLQNTARQQSLVALLKETEMPRKEGLAYLIAYMPSYDLDTLGTPILRETIEYGYKALENYSWTQALPKEIFYNEVLPYASMDETRELWRAKFYEMFSPLVANATTIEEAIDTVNKSIKKMVNVEYNTKRKKPNQSPSESMAINMASCSGLSILLTDALRAVGIPSRIAGTPMWVSMEGNHNWSEVNINGEWLFTEYSPNKLNDCWFIERAGKADKSKPIHWVYATSFKPTGLRFPMVWNRRDTTIFGVDVTDRYIQVYNAIKAVNDAKGTPVRVRMYKDKSCSPQSDTRVVTSVKALDNNKKVVAEGMTVGPEADMNYYLTLYFAQSGSYELVYQTAKGEKRQKLHVKENELQDISIYWE